MLGEPLLRRYALSRSGLAVGTALILGATGPVPRVWFWSTIAVALVTLVAVLWGRNARARLSAVVSGDIALPLLLVPMTGGEASPFLMFFYMAVVLTGASMGTGTAIAAAGLVALAMVTTMWVVPAIFAGASTQTMLLQLETMFQSPSLVVKGTVSAALLFLVAILSGYLATSFRRRTDQLLSARHELSKSRRNTDLLADTFASGILVVDGDGRITRTNEATVRILGPALAKAQGKRASDVLTGNLTDVGEEIAQTLSEGAIETYRQTLCLPSDVDGDRWVTLSITGGGSGKGGVFALLRDTTAERAAVERTDHRDRLAALGAHSAGIVHELRNLLKPLSGAVELLESDPGGHAERGALFALIRDECDAIETFLEELLRYSRDTSIVKEPTRLDELLERIVTLVRHDPECASVRVELECPSAIEMAADANVLERALHNVVRNSAQAAPNGHVWVKATALLDGVRVEVTDDGPGVDEAIRDKIFEPFFTTKRGGTGLGLAGAKRAVEQHAGELTLEIPEGGGSTFVIRLPNDPADEAIAAA